MYFLGNVRKDADGYIILRKTDRRGLQIREHNLIAERTLGGPLPKGAIVHHINYIKHDNNPENLMICRDTAHHRTFHMKSKSKKTIKRIRSINKGFAKRILTLRIANKGLSQTAFGERIGVSQTYVSMLEKGSRMPSETLIIAISAVFKINSAWLRCGRNR